MKAEIKKLLVVLGAVLLKVGGKLLVIAAKLAKALKLGKVGLAGATMASYSYLFTWQFALLIMVTLAVHESGHVWAMRRRGIPTKGFYFIPLIGGAAVADKEFGSDEAESFVAIMGPIWGLALVFIAMAGYLITENVYFGAAAAWMALINLFNLLPINPLDGGRILKSVAFSIHSRLGIAVMILGLVVGFAALFWLKIGLFAFILFIGWLELIFELKRHAKPKTAPMTERAKKKLQPMTEGEKTKLRRTQFADRYKSLVDQKVSRFDFGDLMTLFPSGEWSKRQVEQLVKEKFDAEIATLVHNEIDVAIANINRERKRRLQLTGVREDDVATMLVWTIADITQETDEEIQRRLSAGSPRTIWESPDQIKSMREKIAQRYDNLNRFNERPQPRPRMTKKELLASIGLYVLVAALLFGVIELLHGLPGVDLIHTFLAG